jgi:hypothetical protein
MPLVSVILLIGDVYEVNKNYSKEVLGKLNIVKSLFLSLKNQILILNLSSNFNVRLGCIN